MTRPTNGTPPGSKPCGCKRGERRQGSRTILQRGRLWLVGNDAALTLHPLTETEAEEIGL